MAVAPAGAHHDPVRPGCREDRGFDEGGDRLAAIEPRAERRHGEPDVLGHQCDERVDVGELPGTYVPVEQLGNTRIGRVGWQHARPGAHGLAGPREQAVHRGRRDAEHFPHLGVAEAEHVVQEQRGALARRQPLQRRHERQADLFAPDHLVLRINAARQLGVADRLYPQQAGVGYQGEAVGRAGRAVIDRVQAVQAHVGGDLVQPAGERAGAVEARQPPPRPDQRVL